MALINPNYKNINLFKKKLQIKKSALKAVKSCSRQKCFSRTSKFFYQFCLSGSYRLHGLGLQHWLYFSFNSNRHPEKAIPFVPQNYCNPKLQYLQHKFWATAAPKNYWEISNFWKNFFRDQSSFYHPFSWFKRFCGKKNPLKCSIVKILDRYLVLVYRRKIQKIMTFFLTYIVI